MIARILPALFLLGLTAGACSSSADPSNDATTCPSSNPFCTWVAAQDSRTGPNDDIEEGPVIGPCLLLSPSPVEFGGDVPGHASVVQVSVNNCGDAPLQLYAIRLTEGSSPDFALDLVPLGHEPTADDPVSVLPGESAAFAVTFTPGEVNPLDEQGSIVLDTGTVVVESNAPDSPAGIPLSGAGVELICPIPVIKVVEGNEVTPPTVLHLQGDESYSLNGTVQKWEWDVDGLSGGASLFVPSYTFPNPTFEVTFAGEYTFYLTVYDQANIPSCYPAETTVIVLPDEPIHIELLWHTPEDQDETDTGPEVGSDVDLHFLHPFATGPDVDSDGAPDGWFDNSFDCYAKNPNPDWGSTNPGIDDNPSLDREDADGRGPELLSLSIPENVIYRIGAHYPDGYGFGAAYVTLRVYIYAQLVFHVTDIMLVEEDLWDICTVEWPSGKVHVTTDGAGNYEVTPDYPTPF